VQPPPTCGCWLSYIRRRNVSRLVTKQTYQASTRRDASHDIPTAHTPHLCTYTHIVTRTHPQPLSPPAPRYVQPSGINMYGTWMPERVQDDLNHTELAHVRAKLVRARVGWSVHVCAGCWSARSSILHSMRSLLASPSARNCVNPFWAKLSSCVIHRVICKKCGAFFFLLNNAVFYNRRYGESRNTFRIRTLTICFVHLRSFLASRLYSIIYFSARFNRRFIDMLYS